MNSISQVHMVGIDIFTGKRYEDICPSTHNMDVPNVKRVEYSVRTFSVVLVLFLFGLIQLIDIDNDGYVSLMDDSSDTRSDIKLPEGDLGQEIKSKFENGEGVKVTVLQALGEEAIITCKNDNESRK